MSVSSDTVFTARCYACAVLAMGLCPCLSVCVCLSVTSRSSTKMAKRGITQTQPHDSSGSGTLVFDAKDLRGIQPWSPPTGAPNARGVVKIGDFGQIAGSITQTVQDRHIVSVKVNRKSYALYRMVTLRMTSSDPETTPICTFCTASHILIMTVVRNFKFCLYVSGSKSQPADEKYSPKGARIT